MHKISLAFDLYRIHDRVYEGVLVHFDGHADLEDILKNNFIFGKNFTIDNFHFDQNAKNYIQRIRANEKKLIKDAKDFLTADNVSELFFESIPEFEDPVLDDFSGKFFNKFYPN